MLRAQKKNGDVAAKSIPNANHGRNNSQHKAVIMVVRDSDSSTLPYNGCSGFGSNIAKK